MNAVAPRIDRCTPADRRISVLIVDDSVVARAALSHMVQSNDALALVATVESAARAIAMLCDHRVDVILLDLEMPGWNGLEALPELLVAGRGARILVVSSTARAGAEATLQALAAGAADTLAKPAAGQLNQAFAAILVDRIERLGRAATDAADSGHVLLRAEPATPIALLGIGASTGGLSALAAFFAALDPAFDAPIVVTQHLPPAFMPYFADQLATMAGRVARVGEPGMPVQRGEIVVAPGRSHLVVSRNKGQYIAELSDAPVVTRCCPSVDPMFGSLADIAGPDAAAVVMTGMGRDGTEGAARLVAAGGSVLIQDRESSAVWGMPGSVAKANLACVIGRPARLAEHIMRRGAL